MSTVQQIEDAITRLKPNEIKKLASWLTDRYPEFATWQRLSHLRQARGIWKNHRTLPDVRKLRGEFDRF